MQAPPDPPRRYVSAREVAERAGVSRSAVSRTMTAGASVSVETRRKVEQAAADLGYEVNILARGLLDRHSPIVALFSSSIGSPFMSGLLPAVTAALLERGLAPLLINVDTSPSQLERFGSLGLQLRSAATIFLSGSPPDGLVQKAIASGRPVIVLNRAEDRADRLVLDNAAVGAAACRALVEAGARRLCVVLPSRRTASMIEREHAFLMACGAHDVEIESMTAPENVGPRLTADYRAGQDVSVGLFGRNQPPDGVFCTNDHLALGMMDAARYAYRLKLPEQVSIIGCDDVPMAGWDSYRLTTFRQDPTSSATTLIDMLDRRLAMPDLPPAHFVMEAPIVWRDSVRRPPLA